MNKLQRDIRLAKGAEKTFFLTVILLFLTALVSSSYGFVEQEMYKGYSVVWWFVVTLGFISILVLVYAIRKGRGSAANIQLRSKSDEFIGKILENPEFEPWHQEAKRLLEKRSEKAVKKRKPKFHNYVLAHTSGVCTISGVLLALGCLYYWLYSQGVLSTDWRIAIVAVIINTPMVAMVGSIIGTFFLWHISGIGHPISRIQGAPFHIGTSVWILSGKHKDTLTQVYDLWTERGQVRVDLGQAAKKTCEDVFCIVEICRAKDTD